MILHTFYPLLLVLLITFHSHASAGLTLSKPTDNYLDYLERYANTLGPLGNAEKGEIEIIKDPQKRKEIEATTNRRVGVVAEDKYWIWINDAVKFPNGKYGVYGRLLWRQSLKGTTGVAVMAILPNGKIVLNRNYRHATRSWEYELTRGAIQEDEAVQAAAEREVIEETGMVIRELRLLGNMAPDSGITNAVIPIFLAKVVDQQEAQPEDSEAIAAIEAFSVAELKKGFIDGYLSAKVDGITQQIPLRDPFLAFALFQADLRNFLPRKPRK